MVYPLPTPVIGVDQKLTSGQQINVPAKRGSEVSESYVNHGGALRILINVWWEVGRANILPIGVTGVTVIT